MFVIAAAMFASCSKAKLNKRLDGQWSVVTINGVAFAPNTAVTVFTKDKKGKGVYSSTVTISGAPTATSGTYELEDDTKIMMTQTGQSTPVTKLVKDYSKTDMTITDADGSNVTVLKKD